jgi:ATP-binding cassette subfamily B protein/ATP-binding cassette subfamily C protein
MNVERAYAYYVELRTDYQNGVDIRINNMFSLLLSKINSYNKNEKNLHFTVGRNNCISEIISNIISGIQLVTIYSFIVCKVFVGSISISGFYLYTNILIQFIDTVTQIMIHYSNMHNAMNYYCAYPEMWDLNKFSKKYCQISNTESRNTERNIAIEFSNVTFYYPGTTKTVLKDISFQIEYNSHVSIVGRNGAGKSTIIKLMLGLYEPQKGSIFINGINIKTMDKKDILNYFSVVFQDFKLLANTVSSNIATSDVYDLTKIMSIIEEVGLADRLSSYEMLNTEVSRHLSNEGVEFSGGEKTKIAIARALYRDSSFLVMDEPTASLDPLSEEKIFRLLEKLAEKRTTITISHRLSSCRNSDNILVLSDGSIIEEGTHDKLVKIGGLYSLMWNSQAEYYNGVCVDDND